MGDLTAASMSVPGPQPDAPARARTAPTGFEPGVRYSGGVPVEVTTPALPGEAEGMEWAAGIVPPGYRLVLREAKFDPAAWHRDEGFVTHPSTGHKMRAPAVTRPVWRYRFDVVPVVGGAATADDLLAVIDRWRPPKRPPVDVTGRPTFVVCCADWQVGKVDQLGGTDATVTRVLRMIDAAVAEYRRSAKRGEAGGVLLAGLGDGCEGHVSQGGRLAWRTDMTVTEMVRVYRRLMAYAVTEFAKVAPRVTVVQVPGNHDEATRHPVTTRPDDSWDVDAVSAVADACAMNPALEHVAFVFPKPDTGVVVLDVAGTVVAFAHGHQMKGDAVKWWAGQAHGMQPAGDAVLLITAHYHCLKVIETGCKTWLQATTADNGSQWWTTQTGDDVPPGLTTLLVGSGTWDRLRVLR